MASDEAGMDASDDTDGVEDYLKDVLSEHELSIISKDVTQKLNSYLCKHVKPADEQEHGGGIRDGVNNEKIQIELIEVTKKYEEAMCRLSAAEDQVKTAEDVECQLHLLKEQNLQLQNDVTNLQLHSDKIVDEKNMFQQIIKRRDKEIQDCTDSYKALATQLSHEMAAKFEATALRKEMEGKEQAIKLKETVMQEEKQLLITRISFLNDEVHELTSNAQILQTKCTRNEIYYEKKIKQLTDELALSQKTIAQLKETNTKLSEHFEALSKKLITQKEVSNKMQCDYLKEINTKSKLADIYKMMNDESESKVFELKNAVTDLQKMLDEATEKYGQLETENMRIQADLEETNSNSEMSFSFFASALQHANEQLTVAKDNKSQQILKYISPTAAIVNKLLKSELPLSQVYDELLRVSEELAFEKKRNGSISDEINESLEEITASLQTKKQRMNHTEMLEENDFKQQLDSKISQCESLTTQLNNSVKMIKFHIKENSHLKKEVTNLGKQVCYLLKEVELLRSKTIPNGDYDSHSLDADDNITFGDIKQLQRNNQMLLRNLNEKDSLKKDDINKILSLESKITDLTVELHQKSSSFNTLKQQRDMYKSLYHENMSMTRNQSMNDSNMTVEYSSASIDNSNSVAEQKSINSEQIINHLKQEYEAFREEKINNEKLLYDQIDKMRKEMVELTTLNCKHVTAAVLRNEQLKILNTKLEQSDIIKDSSKEKIQILQINIQDYETMAKQLSDDITGLQNQLASTQLQLNKKVADIQVLHNAEVEHKTECNALRNELSRIGTVLRETEIMKTIIENTNTEKCNKLEQELEESILNCTAVQKRFEEERDGFRKLTLHLESKLSKANAELSQQCEISEALRKEVGQLTEDRNNNKTLIKELEYKISQLPAANSVGFLQNSEKDTIIQSLELKITNMKENEYKFNTICEQYKEMFKKFESDYRSYKFDAQTMISQYKEQIECVQRHCREIEKNLLEKHSSENSTVIDINNELERLNAELRSTKEKLEKCQNDRDNLNKDLEKMAKFYSHVENKYSEEVKSHAGDIQIIQNIDLKLLNNQANFFTLNTTQNNGVTESSLDADEVEQHNAQILKTIDALKYQNAGLHDQVKVLTAQLKAVVNARGGLELMSTESEDSTKADKFGEQMTIISLTEKCKVLEAEKLHLNSLLETTSKHFEDYKLMLSEKHYVAEDELFDDNMQQVDLLRKIEASDALCDSNKALRENNKTILSNNKGLCDRVKSLQDELEHLKEKISELSSANAGLKEENKGLNMTVEKWKNRVDSLIENVNMASPEDWIRLKGECEHLMVQLYNEREEAKKRNDDSETIKMEKYKLEEKFTTISQQYNTLLEEHKKVNDNYQKNITEVNSLTEKICALKIELADSLKKCNELKLNLSKMEASLSDIREKEMQIRKIARKYKQQYNELLETAANEKKEEGQRIELQITDLKHQLEVKTAESEKSKADLESSIQKEDKAKQYIKVAKNKIVCLTEVKKKLTQELLEAQTKITTLEKSPESESDQRLALLISQYETKIAKLEKDKEDLKLEKEKEVDALMQKINLQRQLPNQMSKQATEKAQNEPPPTANIKPMASSSSASTSNIRRGGETPLASVRPVAQVQCLVPPVHDAHSTEYMPASSSRSIIRAAPPESTQDSDESQPPQQAVAMVMPRVESQAAPPSSQSGVSTSNAQEQRPQKRPHPTTPTVSKKTRVDEEYQVPTSSQRDQDDEGVIVVESDEECAGTTYEVRTDRRGMEEDEVEADGQEIGAAEIAPEESSREESRGQVPAAPQIEAISSGTEPSGALSLAGGDDGDDGIVPSTPTLYVPRRNDGFGEAVVSPLSGANAVPTGARFTFAEAGEASHHDTHADLTVALPPTIPEDWVPSVTSNQTEAIQQPEENREAEATSAPSNEAQPHIVHRRGPPDFRGRNRGRGRGFRRPHGWMRF